MLLLKRTIFISYHIQKQDICQCIYNQANYETHIIFFLFITDNNTILCN